MTDSPWEEVGPYLAWDVLFETRADLERTLDDVDETLRAGSRPTAGQVGAIHRELEALQQFNEEVLAVLADGTEPWERGPQRMPFWVLERTLNTDHAGRSRSYSGHTTGGGDEY